MSSSSLKTRYLPWYEVQSNANLCTMQKRVRHLTSVIGRNIDFNLLPGQRQMPKSSLLSLHFTIHAKDRKETILYKSETLANTLNPNWKEFDSSAIEMQAYLQMSCVIIYIWGARKCATEKKIIRYDVSFSGLVYVKDNLSSSEHSYNSNSIFFGMFGGYYMAPNSLVDIRDTCGVSFLLNTLLVNSSLVINSYKKTSLLRVHNSIKAIYGTRIQVSHIKKEIKDWLLIHERFKQKRTQKENIKCRIELLRAEMENLKEKLSDEKAVTDGEEEEVLCRKQELNQRLDEQMKHQCEVRLHQLSQNGHKEMLLKILTHLNFRRRQLAAELSYIYPIIELPMKDDNKKEYTISGVTLPNSEDFVGKDENMLAVAVGNVAHLVYMMAKFMELPLRYPIRPMGSRSCIFDLVTDKLTDKQREFPLYLKGKERFQFHYAVFLINKNIAQLRYHNGLGTPDLRNTLVNLKHLLEAKYGVRIVVRKENSGFNSAVMMANRSITLPYVSSLLRFGQDSVNLGLTQESVNIDIPVVFSPDIPASMKGLQSETLSGLQDVHVKVHQQHRFLISRNMLTKLKSDIDDTEGLDTPPSPDLIEVPFEDVVRKTIDGQLIQRISRNEESKCSETENVSATELAEDFLNGNVCKDNNHIDSLSEQGHNFSSSSDNERGQLVIPNSCEREEDLSISPCETIMV